MRQRTGHNPWALHRSVDLAEAAGKLTLLRVGAAFGFVIFLKSYEAGDLTSSTLQGSNRSHVPQDGDRRYKYSRECHQAGDTVGEVSIAKCGQEALDERPSAIGKVVQQANLQATFWLDSLGLID